MLGASVIVCLIAISSVGAQTERVVELAEQGNVRGYRDVSGDFFSFFDIPYATTPSGSHKFKGPLPPPVWSDTFDAVYRGISCTQSAMPGFDEEKMQDDCLVANVFVPDTDATNLPVMVNIHGGAYNLGRGSWLTYTNLVKTKRLIVVTFNYRLGIQGFLCLGTKDVPGNAGLKDQVALLRWVQKNIANFGGNPNDVTIQGCSAGGGSVDFLSLSPMAKGLFNKGIAESGSVFGYVGAVKDPIESAKTYAKILNFTNVDDIEALEEFYKTASNEVLNFGFADKFSDDSVAYFTPCVERDTGTGEEIFISESPWSIVTSGQYPKIPFLYGYTEHEGMFQVEFLANQGQDFNQFLSKLSSNFSQYLPFDLQFESYEEKEEVAKSVREFYFGFGDTIDEQLILKYVDYYTDIFFAYPMLTGLRLRRAAKSDTIYLYEFGYSDENTDFIPNTNVRSVNHCEQTNTISDAQTETSNLTPEFIQMQRSLRNMWINFVVSGNPVIDSSLPEWLPVSGLRAPHMALRSEFAMRDTLILEDRAQFWDDIYAKHYRHPLPPGPSNDAVMMRCELSSIIIITYLAHFLRMYN